MDKISLIFIVGMLVFSCKSSQTSTPDDKVPSGDDLALAPAVPAFDELIGISPLIFTGIVSGIHYGNHKQSAYPFTFFDFKGVELIRNKGNIKLNSEKSLQISYMGGINPDNTITEVDEFPKFELGQRYLVFIRGGAWKLSPIAGNSMGVYQLYGSLEDDPILLTADKSPVKAVENGRIVYAHKLMDEKEEAEIEKSEKALIKRTGKSLSSEQIEKLENEMKFRDKELLKEEDIVNQYARQFDTVLKLSDLVKEIRIVEDSLDMKKYEKFSSVFFVPLETKRDMEPKSPGSK